MDFFHSIISKDRFDFIFETFLSKELKPPFPLFVFYVEYLLI